MRAAASKATATSSMTGTFKKPEPKRQVTLIEAEAFDAVARDYEIEMEPGEARRNIVTRGIGAEPSRRPGVPRR